MPPYQKKDIPYLLATGFVLLAIPVAVFFANQQKNINSNAAGLSKVEAESGTVAGNVTTVNDANASGGQYVKLGTVSSATGPEFPRLGGMLIGNPHNYNEVPYQQQIAKLDMAVLGMYPFWGAGGKTPAQAVNEIKALNPNIILGNYTIMTEVPNSADSATANLRTKLGAEKGPNNVGDWWAYNAAGQHTDWAGGDFGSWDTNLTLLVTPDSNGDRWPQWKAKLDFTQQINNANWDMWYTDNNFWKPRVDADWNRDGINDSQDSIAIRNQWRNGQRAYYDTAKALAPNKIIMVNADSDLDGTVFPSNADDFTQYENVVHGGFIEFAMGKDWSVESWSTWQVMMNWYRNLKTNLIGDKIIMFSVYMPNTTDYQFLRYALASSLMDDGYFVAATDYNQVPWFDEFDLAGTSNTKWLGKAIDSPRTSAWQNGVYRRNFERGTVLVNPKGNGQKTVTIEAGYRRIQGSQAPTVNNGQPVTSVTLNDRDGILLIKN